MEAGRQKLITADILKEMKEKDRSKEQSWKKKNRTPRSENKDD